MFAALAVSWSGGARAAEVSVEREARAMDCPDAAELEEAMAKQRAGTRAGEAPGRKPGEGTERIEVRIARDDEGYEALIDAPRGLRRIRDPGPSCEGLAAALAVTLALILDELGEGKVVEAPAEEGAAPAEPPGQAPLRPEPEPDLLPTLRPRRRAPARPDEGPVLVHLLAGPTLGFLTPLSFALLGDLELRMEGRLSFGLGGAWLPTRTVDYPAAAYPEGEVDVSLAAGMGRACVRAAGSEYGVLDFCLMPALGALRGEGRHYRTNRVASEPWVALGAGAVASGSFAGRLGWSSRLGFFVPLTRPSFTVTSRAGEAFQSPQMALLLVAGFRAAL